MTRPDASAELVQLGETLLEVNDRHERLIDGLLLLARSEHELVDRRRSTWPTSRGHVVATSRWSEARAASVTLTEAAGPAPTGGDPVLLERLAQNLVENAIRHNSRRRLGPRCTTGAAGRPGAARGRPTRARSSRRTRWPACSSRSAG